MPRINCTRGVLFKKTISWVDPRILITPILERVNPLQWELRDGKFYRRDVVSISGGEQQRHTVKVKCPNCPTHLDRIQKLTIERDNLQRMLTERDALIAQLKARLEKLEFESRNWLQEKNRLETIIREREKTIRELRALLDERKGWVPPHILKEKETIIIRMQNQIRDLEAQLAGRGGLLKEKETLVLRIKELEGQLAQRDAEIGRLNGVINDLRARIKELEDLLIQCRSTVREVHVAPAPPKEDMRWYYAVQNSCHAQLFQQHPRYLGGEIMVDSLEGATVVNPEYYTQSEQVPGNARLRVRVVEAQGVQINTPGTELFVRLRLGSATQFTHPRPVSYPAVSWQQDFVFVGVPLKSHPFHPHYQASTYPLIVEIIARTIGTACEQIVGTGEVDLVDLVAGLTRVIFINVSCGGVVNIRLKALDFGLPAGGVQQAVVQPVQQVVMRRGSAEMRTQVRTRTEINVSDAETARRLDASDGVMDGKMGGNQINVREGLASQARAGSNTHYNVNSDEMARRLDASDGVIDGKFKGAEINVRH
jgi:predicted  nucleic acid-binding Zn-ribbon protein